MNLYSPIDNARMLLRYLRSSPDRSVAFYTDEEIDALPGGEEKKGGRDRTTSGVGERGARRGARADDGRPPS